MNSFARLSGKHFAAYDSAGNLLPMTEIVIVTSQPEFRIDGETGHPEAFSKANTFQFVASADDLRAIANLLLESATNTEAKITTALGGAA